MGVAKVYEVLLLVVYIHGMIYNLYQNLLTLYFRMTQLLDTLQTDCVALYDACNEEATALMNGMVNTTKTLVQTYCSAGEGNITLMCIFLKY